MASSLFLQFLLNFPLKEKQLEQHLTFSVANLGYEYEAGRSQALDMVHQIVLKLPQDMLKAKHEMFYFPLVERLSKETVPSLRDQIIKVSQRIAFWRILLCCGRLC